MINVMTVYKFWILVAGRKVTHSEAHANRSGTLDFNFYKTKDLFRTEEKHTITE